MLVMGLNKPPKFILTYLYDGGLKLYYVQKYMKENEIWKDQGTLKI